MSQFFRGVLCSILKPFDKLLGWYTPLPVPGRSWKCFDRFLGGLLKMRCSHDYLYVSWPVRQDVVPNSLREDGSYRSSSWFVLLAFWEKIVLPSSNISSWDNHFLINIWWFCEWWWILDWSRSLPFIGRYIDRGRKSNIGASPSGL